MSSCSHRPLYVTFRSNSYRPADGYRERTHDETVEASLSSAGCMVICVRCLQPYWCREKPADRETMPVMQRWRTDPGDRPRTSSYHDELDDEIARWHVGASGDGQSLQDFLGFTHDEWGEYLRTPETLMSIVFKEFATIADDEDVAESDP